MGVNFGSLTNTSKMNFKITSSNPQATGLNTEYNKQWNIFDEARKKAEGAQNSGGNDNQAPDIASIQSEMREAYEKLDKLQTALAKESGAPTNNDNTPTDDKDEKNKVKGKSLEGMMA